MFVFELIYLKTIREKLTITAGYEIFSIGRTATKKNAFETWSSSLLSLWYGSSE
jgi:hypothetical protein